MKFKHSNGQSFVLLARLFLACLMAFLAGCCIHASKAPSAAWRGVHVPVFSDQQLVTLEGRLPKLAEDGVNVLVLQIDYHFDYQSHPELRDSTYVTLAKARGFTVAARKLGIRVIPELDCLGHQSIHSNTLPLLVKYPQFDETPGLYPGNKGIYCRSWCPQSPGLHEIVYALIDELTDAFQADAFHVGMDEVWIIANTNCPRCQGHDPAKLFADEVTELHQHIVTDRKLTMLIWGDRLLDAKTMGYGRWESAVNGTAGAVDLIPKDIIVCDWHYRAQTNYPSVPFLLNKGFCVWPSSFEPLAAAKAFSQFSLAQRRNNPRVVGFLCTTWSKSHTVDVSTWPPVADILPDWK